jgi:ubiquinone/menaquinone biosynthesis C-methylase UbiE
MAGSSFRLGDAHALPVEDESFDAAVAGLVLNFVTEPARALRDMRRAVRPGGTVAVYVWDYVGETHAALLGFRRGARSRCA